MFFSSSTYRNSVLSARGKGIGVLCSAFFLVAMSASAAGDWPTYRGDSRRGGYAAESLPKNLSLQWTYRARHAPRPAWPGRDMRMPFDRAYHPVISAGRLFFGSSADCKVYALDAATGKERWTFFTDAPVRFAPALWKDRLFVVSDDGYLYCLSAKDGRELWKFLGGPTAGRILGNDRMISRWPARGGPVIADGIVYFAAGIWPSEGVFIHAIDAATGKQLWCNDDSGSIYMLQPHPTAYAKSGVSAQGYLVVAGDHLVAPTGRALPAAFRRADGKFAYFHLQEGTGYSADHSGGGDVVATDRHYFNAGSIFNTATGHLINRGLKISAAAVTGRYVVYASGNEIVALNRQGMVTREPILGAVDRRGRKIITTKAVLREPAWRMKIPHGAQTLIISGRTAIVGNSGRVSLLDMASKKLLDTIAIDGMPYGLAVADGRLYVSTDRGRIHCFGTESQRAGGAKEITPETLKNPYPENSALAAAAEEIIRRSGVTEGYCLDLAAGVGQLAYELARRTKLHIIGIDKDAENVALARKRLDAAGLYGVRVTIHHGDPGKTVYPNYFANLIVSGRSVTSGPDPSLEKETARILRPWGGVALTGRPGAMKKALRGALDGAGQWTHQYSDAANTNCSADRLIKGPLGMLWFKDFNFQMPTRHGRGPAPLLLNGRLFVEGVNAIRCIDAYNGRMIWEYPLSGVLKAYDQGHLIGTAGTGSNFCVTGEGLYVRTGRRCLRIDPRSGRLLNTFDALGLDDATPGVWGAIACVDGTLFGTLDDTEHLVKWAFQKSDMRTLLTESKLLFALDARTGKEKWRYRPTHSIRHNSIAIGGGRVYLIDRPMAAKDRIPSAKRRGEKTSKHPPGVLVALNADTGEEIWRKADDIFGTVLALGEPHDALVMAYSHTSGELKSERGGRMAVFRASDGRPLWSKEIRDGRSRPILNARTIYNEPGAWDLLTGQRKDFTFARTYGCGILSGSRHLLLYRSGTLGYTDLSDNRGTENYGGIRPGCWINAIPAGGLVLMPDASDRCACSYLNKASIALQQYGVRAGTGRPKAAPSGARAGARR